MRSPAAPRASAAAAATADAALLPSLLATRPQRAPASAPASGIARLKMSARRWAGRALLAGAGIVAALAVIEGLLRLAGLVYQPSFTAKGNNLLGSDGTYRVLCLGESTTAGIESGDQAYPYLLEDILNEKAAGKARFEVTNGGRPATTTDVIVANLPEMLERIDPHIVVTMMGINDGNLIEPVFQTDGSLRVWKLLKMLYLSYRPPPVAEQVEDLLVRAEAALEHWPETAAELAAQAEQLMPGDPRVHITLAEARIMLNEIEPAAASYLKAFEVDAPAVVAYAFDAGERFIGVLDWVASRMPQDSSALATRAVVAFRRREMTGADYFSRRAAEIDPRDALAMVINGRALELMGSPAEARRRLEAAAETNPRLVYILAGDLMVGSPELAEIAARAHRDGIAPTAGETSQERWLLRARSEFAEGLRGLHLRQSWEQIASGATEEAAAALRGLADASDEVSARVRIRALGQLAILAWQAGDVARAEEHHRALDEMLGAGSNPMTTDNYRELRRLLQERGVSLVAVQYPMRRVEFLQRLFEPPDGVVFVDNEGAFKRALHGRPYTEIFTDLFAGDFGHLTVEGNRMLAANVAEAVLGLVPQVAGTLPPLETGD